LFNVALTEGALRAALADPEAGNGSG
jgi:hypothetical protein